MYKVQPLCWLFKKVQFAYLPIELELVNQELFFHGSTSRSSKMLKAHVVFSCISLIFNFKMYYYFKLSKRTFVCNANRIYISKMKKKNEALKYSMNNETLNLDENY
jgi:hypothetical protein